MIGLACKIEIHCLCKQKGGSHGVGKEASPCYEDMPNFMFISSIGEVGAGLHIIAVLSGTGWYDVA